MGSNQTSSQKRWIEQPFKTTSTNEWVINGALIRNGDFIEPDYAKVPSLPKFRMKALPAGSFKMGSIELEREKPEHLVNINAFYIAEVPVTQELYVAVVGKNRSEFEGNQKPVDRIKWFAAIEFCIALNNLLGLESPYVKKKIGVYEWNRETLGFRLPSEAEWEYAAKANSDAEFSGSNNLRQIGWYEGNSSFSTIHVGMKFPNAWGLYDMSGNVFEWCFDSYTRYKQDELNNPVVEKDDSRVLRGGSWVDTPRRCRLAARSGNEARRGWNDYGFRIAFGF